MTQVKAFEKLSVDAKDQVKTILETYLLQAVEFQAVASELWSILSDRIDELVDHYPELEDLFERVDKSVDDVVMTTFKVRELCEELLHVSRANLGK